MNHSEVCHHIICESNVDDYNKFIVKADNSYACRVKSVNQDIIETNRFKFLVVEGYYLPKIHNCFLSNLQISMLEKFTSILQREGKNV
jgi:hypothetical protein